MTTLEDLVIKFNADTKDIMVKLDKLQAGLEKTQKKAGLLDGQFKKVAATLVGTFTLKKAFGEFTQAVNYMDDMADAADRVGISSEAFSKLAYAAKITEVPIGALEIGLRKMQLALVEASSNDSSKAAKVLEFLRLDAEKLRSVGADEAIALIADELNKIPDPAQRAAASQTIFGRGAIQLTDMLKEGGDAIRAYGDEAERFGVVVGGEAAQKAEDFKKALVRLESQWQGMVMEMAQEGVLDNAITAVGGLTTALSDLVVFIKQADFMWRKWTGNLDENSLDDIGKKIDEVNRKRDKLLERPQSSRDLDAWGARNFGTTDPLEELNKEGQALAKKRQELENEARIAKIREQDALIMSQGIGGGTAEPSGKTLFEDDTESAKEQAKEIDKLRDKAISYYEDTFTEAEKLEAKISEVRELQLKGAFESQEQYNRVLTDLEDKLADADDGVFDLKDAFNEVGDTIQNRLGDELVDAMKRGENAGQAMLKALEYAVIDAFGDLMGQQIKSGIGGLFGGKGGKSGGGLGDLLGNVGSSIWDALPSFDSGGFTGNGSGSGVDGKGGFPALLHPNEMVLNQSQQRGLGGGGGKFTQNVIINATSQSEIDRRIQAQIPQIGRYAANMVNSEMGRGGDMSKQIGRRL